MKNVVFAAAFALCAVQAFAETHTVTFRRMNGTVLSKVEVEHGANATSFVPPGPDESANNLSFSRWDLVDKLACVTNDVTCWALYEATTAKSPSTSISSKSVAYRETPYSLDEYFQMYDNLAWSDEYSGSELSVASNSGWSWGGWGSDGKNWAYDTGQPDGDGQVFVAGNQEVSDGTLKIICKREATNRITSAMITSKNKVQFKLGRCEIRAKLTNVLGGNTAFWMMGEGQWPQCGELDVFEHVNGNDGFGSNFHHPNPNNTYPTIQHSFVGMTEDGTRWGDAFHRIGVILNERELLWYVDDHIYQRLDIRDSRFDSVRNRAWYVILNYSFCTRLSGITDLTDSRVAKFMRDVYEIDYCRIFTNTNADNTVVRNVEPDGARLSGPVKATVWRGWQMNWGKQGSNYYMDHLVGNEPSHIRKALREYLGRDKVDVLAFLTIPTQKPFEVNRQAHFDVPGYSVVNFCPNAGSGYNDWDKDIREKLLGAVLFNKERFFRSDSAISALQLSNDYSFTNCSAVVAELVEKETGAKVKVVGVNMLSTNMVGVSGSVAAQGMSALMSKLDAMKNEKVILLLQGEGRSNWNYIDNRVKTELRPSFSRLGQFTSVWPVYQSAWVTANYSASAENPAPLKLGTSNTYTNQAYCATVQFEAPLPIVEVEPLATNQYAKSVSVTFAGAPSNATLTNFPVLVKLSAAIPGFSYADFNRPNGGDLRFADANGNLLAHEIDTWNESGVSTVWVKVPQLTKDTAITAHYGYTGSGNPAAVDPKDVWDSDYLGVWHLGAAAGVSTQPDSTSNGKDFGINANNSDGVASGADGIVGRSAETGIRTDGKGCFFQSDTDKLFVNKSAFTVETWTWQDDHEPVHDGNLRYVLAHSGQNEDSFDWRIYENNKGKLVMQFYSLGTLGKDDAKIYADDGATRPARAQWNHTAFAWDGSSGQLGLYLGGNPLAIAASVLTNNWTGTMNGEKTGFNLGNHRYDNTKSFKGRIDEVRISKVARSAAWIKATHDTIANADFATYAVEGAVPPAPVELNPVLVVTVNAGVTNTLSAITNVTAATWITNVVKRGAGTLIASGMPSSFGGLITVEAGVWQGGNSAGDFGLAGTVIDVKDGASLEFVGSTANVLNGKTVNLYGAKAGSLNAKILFSNAGAKNLGSNVTINLKDADEQFYVAKDYVYLGSGTIDLGGRELRVKSNANWRRMEIGATIVNGGSLVFDKCQFHCDGTRIPTFSADCASTATLKFLNGAEMNWKKLIPSNGWTLHCEYSTMHGNVNNFPGKTDYPGWDGPVVFNNNSNKVADWTGGYNVSNTVFNLKGPISGSGELAVGPGWLNLHNAGNTYTGAVTVKGEQLTSSVTNFTPILPGSGGIGLFNGAKCFPNASSVTFTDSARLQFMDDTVTQVGTNVVFAGGAGDLQTVSGGNQDFRPTIGRFTKTGAGTLEFSAPAAVAEGRVLAGTLKVTQKGVEGATLELMTIRQPQFDTLEFASGTLFDLSDNIGVKVDNLVGSPTVTNSGVFGIMENWKLTDPAAVMTLKGENVSYNEQSIAAMLAFGEGATFTIADEEAFSNAVVAAGASGLEVARAHWVFGNSTLVNGMAVVIPQPSAGMKYRWAMEVGAGNTTLRLKFAPAGGYAAWIAEKGITDNTAPDYKTNGIENGVRYAFDIDPASATVGDPIIKVVRDANGNPVVESRELAEGRDDVTFGILATENLADWSSATLIPMKKFETDGYWKPTASESSTYVFPAKLFFKYTIGIK